MIVKFKENLEALVLAALAEGPAHGYEIAKRIRQHGGRHFQCGDSRLYPVLHRLEQKGALHSRWEMQEGVPNRKVYELSEEGAGLLQHHQQEWQAFSSAVSGLLKPLQEVSYA